MTSPLTLAERISARERWRLDPVAFAREALGITTLWSRQIEILESVRDNRVTNVPAGNGIGKDFTASILVPWWMCTLEDSMAVTTATTADQVEKILWGEVRTRIQQARVPLGGELAPVAPEWKFPPNPKWYAIGKTSNNPNGFAGHHGVRVLLIRDEAAGISPANWEASRACASGENDRILNIGNPICGAEHPFDVESKLRDEPGRRKTIVVSTMETPNYVEGREVIPGVYGREFVEEMRTVHGEGSVVFNARVKGLFPGSAADGLISLEHLQLARDRLAGSIGVPPQRPRPSDPVYLGIDPARYGDDLTVIYAVQGCHAWLVETLAKADSRPICNAALGAARAHNARGIAIDSTGGYGAGPFDMLREEVGKTPAMRGVRLVEVNFGAKASDPDAHANRRTELWWGMRDWVRGVAAWDGDKLITDEMLAARYKPHGKGIALEPKEEIKKRLGRSPDRADALALAIWAGRAPASAFSGRGGAGRGEGDVDPRDRREPSLGAHNALEGSY